MGRHALPEDVKRDIRITVKVNQAELQELEDGTGLSKRYLAQYLRDAGIEKVRNRKKA